MMRSTSSVTRLPRAFVGFAFLNFLVGAILGGWMAAAPQMWSVVGPIHGEINPFGWLTMLIYGVTYAVLALFAGIRPPRAWVGWLQLCFAEVGVMAVVAGYAMQSHFVLSVGLTFQAIAPTLFLANILSAVFSSRRSTGTGTDPRNVSADTVTSNGLRRDASKPPLISSSEKYKGTDRVARRGTDIALMLFIVAAWWMALAALVQRTLPQTLEPQAAIVLVYYGWIAGTVLAVSLHLFPRLTQISGLGHRAALLGQALWGIGLLLAVVGTGAPVVASVGVRLLGLSFTWHASIYLWTLAHLRPSADGREPMSQPSRLAWSASFVFAWVLGVCLLLGTHPLSLFSLHLLFLGWITTLVYGVGYRLFPQILSKQPLNPHVARAQLLCSVAGATLMAVAFSPIMASLAIGANMVLVTLAVGGVLAAIGAVTFLVQWVLAKPRD